MFLSKYFFIFSISKEVPLNEYSRLKISLFFCIKYSETSLSVTTIWNAFSTRYKWDVLYKLYYRDCVDFLNERNVTPVVYSNYAHKKGIAEGLNQWNMKILDEFPDLYCFAAFHPDDNNGMEIIRVNFNKGESFAVLKDDLLFI